MKSKSRSVTGALVAGAVAIGALFGAAPANATTTHPGGGTFSYGVAGYPGDSWSNYLHPSKKHRSTACNSSWCTRSADKSGGSWAKVAVAASLSGNKAYYYVY
jgi:lactococcin 972 family bacteriocin